MGNILAIEQQSKKGVECMFVYNLCLLYALYIRIPGHSETETTILWK